MNVYVGPSMVPAIVDILLRFRSFKVGLAADIEKAFLNIGVKKEQRDLMRFLWVKDLKGEEPEIVVFRFKTVLFGMSCSPFCLNATLDYHIRKYYKENTEMAEKVLQDFYIDDWTCGGANKDEAFKLFQEVKTCLAAGGFNLRKWASNSVEVSNHIAAYNKEIPCNKALSNDEEKSYAKISLGGLSEIEPGKEHKILGLNWDLQEDKIVLKLSNLADFVKGLVLTKRNILRIPAKLFDPLGLAIPIFIPVRLLFQNLYRTKRDWDGPLQKDEQSTFERWVKCLEGINIELDRCYMQSDMKIECCYLHVFGDASEMAYCAVVYLSFKTTLGWKSVLLFSKAHLAPLSENKTSIPRLDLLAALIAARLVTSVKEALSPVLAIDGTFCWSDSKVILCWLQTDKDYKQFVFNRRKEIIKLTGVDCWRHCAGTENPADLGSRGCFATTLVSSELWWKGPAWLRGPPETYPESHTTGEEREVLENCEKDVKVQAKSSTILLATKGNEGCQLSAIIDIKRFSNWTKLLPW